MDRIKKYIDRFFKHNKMNQNYDMSSCEWMALANDAEQSKTDVVYTTFNYGYAKGYRAAMAEMKKGGAVRG